MRRIFAEYAKGRSPKIIAQRLDKEAVAGPSGAGWTASTINGNWQRGSGILNNELYQGVIAWNKVRYIKNPDTGKHVTRKNPPEEWIRKEVPELRIVVPDIWDRVKLRQSGLRRTHKQFWEKQRLKTLFSSMLRCGCCGGGFSKIYQADVRLLDESEQGRVDLCQPAQYQAGRVGDHRPRGVDAPPDGP